MQKLALAASLDFKKRAKKVFLIMIASIILIAPVKLEG